MDTIVVAAMRGEATRAAAAGDHRMALAWLEPLQQGPSDAASSILRARILSQLGEFDRAIESWQAALAAAPGNAEAERGLAAAERLRGSAVGRLRLHARGWAVALAAAVVVGGAAWAVVQSRRGGAEALAQVVAQFERTRVADQQAVAQRFEQVVQQVRDATQAREVQLQQQIAEERQRRVQMQEQVRRLARRTGEMAAAIEALNQARAATARPTP